MPDHDTGRLLEDTFSIESGPAGTGIRRPGKAAPNVQPGHADSRIFFKPLFLWIGTTILTASVVAIPKIYVAKGVITSAQRDTYNVLTTVLILFLGLSFFEAFKELARTMKGMILRLFNVQEEDKKLVQNFDSLLKVLRLTCVTPNWWFRLFCIIWLLINLGAQISTALISLETSVVDGTNYSGTYLRDGQVQVSNLSCYFHYHKCPTQVTIDALAHAYGETALATECGKYSEIKAGTKSKQDYQYFCQRNGPRQEFAYLFKEYNPNDTQQAYPHFTDRIITAASGDYREYDQVGAAPDKVGNMDATEYTYRITQSVNGSISIPNSSLGREGTTYIYRGTKVPAEASTYSCGPRCILMWAYKNAGATDGPKFYQCPITISLVSNSTVPAHNVSDAVARVAAASIALQGRFEGPIKNPRFTQYQFYASGSPWEVHYKLKETVGANMAEFAIVSLSEMVSKNPPIHIRGKVPFLGSRVSIRWESFSALLTCIVVAQFFVFAFTILVARYEYLYC